MTAEPVPAPAPFDYNAPLPDLHIPAWSWEPAARRYRDLTDDERNTTEKDTER